jgi:transcriptional regulator with XRE-family HTH domain
MSATQELLDTVRKVCVLPSDSALARKFGLTPAAVSNYRQGIRHPEPEIIDALARAIDHQPLEWALRIQAEREEKVNPSRAKVWLRWSKQAASIAASLILALSFGLLNVQTAHAEGVNCAAHNPGTLYIM